MGSFVRLWRIPFLNLGVSIGILCGITADKVFIASKSAVMQWQAPKTPIVYIKKSGLENQSLADT